MLLKMPCIPVKHSLEGNVICSGPSDLVLRPFSSSEPFTKQTLKYVGYSILFICKFLCAVKGECYMKRLKQNKPISPKNNPIPPDGT